MLEGNVGASLHYIAIVFRMCTHFLHAKEMVSDQSLQCKMKSVRRFRQKKTGQTKN